MVDAIPYTPAENAQQTQPETADAHSYHIGEEIRAARESTGLSLQDISEQLHISATYLGAIERLDTKALPSPGYVLGFMRSYAKFLGLDVVEAVARYKVDSEIPSDLGKRNSPHFVERRSLRLPKGSLAAGAILAVFGLLAAWYSMTSTAFTAPPDSLRMPVTADLGLTAQQVKTGDPDSVALKAIAASWVEITDDSGAVIASRIFVPGEIFETRRDTGLTLSARDGGALELYRGGERVGLIGMKGESLKGISLQ